MGHAAGCAKCHTGEDIPPDAVLVRPEREIEAAHGRMAMQDGERLDSGQPLDRPDMWHSPDVHDPGSG